MATSPTCARTAPRWLASETEQALARSLLSTPQEGDMIKSIGPVTLSGPSWTQSVAFRSMQVSERLSEPFLYELEVVSDDADLAPSAVLGEALTVSLEVG